MGEPIDSEEIDIQMPEEVAKCQWIDATALKHFRFTTMAQNMCTILSAVKEAEPIDLKQMPVGDLFKMTSLTGEEYQLLGTKNKLYSSEYLKSIKQLINKDPK